MEHCYTLWPVGINMYGRSLPGAGKHLSLAIVAFMASATLSYAFWT